MKYHYTLTRILFIFLFIFINFAFAKIEAAPHGSHKENISTKNKNRDRGSFFGGDFELADATRYKDM